MTADDARAMTAEAKTVDVRKLELLLTQWDGAITKAAREGREVVRESEVPRLRTPISAAVHAAALAELKRRGFTVVTVTTGPNESETRVTW